MLKLTSSILINYTKFLPFYARVFLGDNAIKNGGKELHGTIHSFLSVLSTFGFGHSITLFQGLLSKGGVVTPLEESIR